MWLLVPAAVVLAAGLAAAAAIAAVTVYSNDFSSHKEVKELRHAEGKHCKKHWRKRSKSLGVTAEKGRTTCGYHPPIEGDGPGSNHELRAKTKLLKDTPKSVRDRVYLGIAVRSGKTSGYEFQVYPSLHKFRLIRRVGDNVKLLAKGKSKNVKGTNKANVLDLAAKGSQLIARVNGKRVAKLADSGSDQVDGRKLKILLGYQKKRKKAVFGSFDNLAVQVPNP